MDRQQSGTQSARPYSAERGRGAAICSFFRHTMAFGRVMRIYAADHPRVEQSLSELKSIADEMLCDHVRDLDIVLHADGLRVDGRPVHQEPAVTETFAEVMRARGIRALVLRCGVQERELALLADIFGRAPRDIASEGGIDALIAGRDHPNLSVLTATTAFGENDRDDNALEEIRRPDPSTRELDEMLGEAGDFSPDPEEEHRLVYTACDKEELGTRSSNLLAVAEETLRAEAARHDAARTAAMALCDMVGRSADDLEYRQRRDLLCDVVHEKRVDPRAMRIAQLHLAADSAGWRHEEPAALLLELGALAGDGQLLEGALGRSDLPATAARRVAESLAARPDAFDLFNTLLRTTLPANIRGPVEEVFAAMVRGRGAAFQKWALANPQRFLCTAAFRVLLRKAETVLGPIVKEYLAAIGTKDRDRLIDLLVEDGTEPALRLVAAAVRDAGKVRDARLILALGRFKHPMAVEVLREVVQRCNTERFDSEQASSAIRALAETGSDDALDFLEEVSTGRKYLIPIYRRTLRELAQDALEVA